MAAAMKLRYVVITSVNRDDLADGGSAHFAETVREVRRALPDARVEVLTPDFCGDLDAVARVLDAGPHVFNHNMETVPRLYKRVRPQANYRQSLDVLRFAQAAPAGVADQIRASWWAWARPTMKCTRCCAICAKRHVTSRPSANICSPRAAICRWPSTSRRSSSKRIANTACRIGFQNGVQRAAGAQFLHGRPW